MRNRRPRVLIADDERFVRESLSEVLAASGFDVTAVDNGQSALDHLTTQEPDVALTDLSMPDLDGLELVGAARGRGLRTPIIVITGVGTIAHAVSAMKSGAFDFVQKPIDPDELVVLVERAVEHRRMEREVHALRARLRGFERTLAGESAAMERVRLLTEQVGRTDSTVLVLGESGTGKELVAHRIHTASQRVRGPLVYLNCSAIPETLFESELFGHRRGAFTGADADRVGRLREAEGGTLVLDEIGMLPAGSQAKLLRVLETGEYQRLGDPGMQIADVRFIAITNEDLEELAQRGGFRRDLFFRLNVFPIRMPALREHPEDLASIASALLGELRGRVVGGEPSAENGAPLSPEAITVLASYDWPGNVRELRNVIERALILSRGSAPDVDVLRTILETAPPVREAGEGDDLHLRRQLDARERQVVLQALSRAGGVKKDAAALLGIDPRNLAYYLRKHEIGDEEFG